MSILLNFDGLKPFFKTTHNVPKKINKAAEFGGYYLKMFGAATQIRTGDLILTNYVKSCFYALYLEIK